jgi:hypothetical protein
MAVNARFLAIAQDPRIIHGVHHHCDEWCDYCPVTGRCLAFRCTAEYRRQRGRRDGQETFVSMDEAIAFTRDLAAAEGLATPELDELTGRSPGTSPLSTSDPLAGVAYEYAVRIAVATAPVARAIAAMRPEPCAPDPERVVLWYHVRIYLRVCRALVAKERTAAGGMDRAEDALGSAKLALVSIQKSRVALQAMRDAETAEEIAELTALLDALERGLDDRFPNARSFVRFGLDVPVG